MIPRPIIYILLVAALIGAAAQYRAHVFTLGVTQERMRRDAIDVERDRQARVELAEVNARLSVKQAELNEALARVNKLKSDLDNEKTASTVLQSDLAAGRRRLSVAIAGACRPAQAGNAEGAAAIGLGPGASATADLDPATAAGLARLTGEGDAAIIRLNACIQAYDAVSAAASASE